MEITCASRSLVPSSQTCMLATVCAVKVLETSVWIVWRFLELLLVLFTCWLPGDVQELLCLLAGNLSGHGLHGELQVLLFLLTSDLSVNGLCDELQELLFPLAGFLPGYRLRSELQELLFLLADDLPGHWLRSEL